MDKNKKGLNTQVVTVYNSDTDDEFEVYVSYFLLNEKGFSNNLLNHDDVIDEDDIQIQHFESNNDVDIPEWVTENLVLESLIEELSLDKLDDDGFWDNENEFDENW